MGEGKLTAKQESFAREYAECGNQSEAYRRAYDVGKDTLQETIASEASRVMKVPKVAAMVFELQEEAKERTLVTVESLTRELEENRLAAKSDNQLAVVNTAIMSKAKLHGLDVQKTEAKVSLSHTIAPTEKLTDFLDGISKRSGETSESE